MILQLCNVSDGDNVVNKTLLDLTQIEVNLKKDFDVINPTILLSGDSYTDFNGFNYCVIPDLNRKYFINSVTQINHNIVSLDCSCDVLETYKNDFLNSNALFYRNLKTGDYYNLEIERNVTKTTHKHLGNVVLGDVNSILMVTLGSL